jgi:probable selenium-dependent hydroxylase accessory protein YqeC
MTDQPLHEALDIDPTMDALIATVGGGGKTTILFALAAERAELPICPATMTSTPKISVLTTTTKFTIPAEAADLPVAFAESPASRATAIEHAWIQEKSAIVVGSGRAERNRVRGVEPDWPRSALTMDIVDFGGVEADGAAGRSFKAPADHEPVLPLGASLVIAVVGVGVLGHTIDDSTVHRPERIRALLKSNLADSLITPQIVARVLSDRNGGRKGVPDNTHFAVVVSSATRDLDGAAAIGQACKESGIPLVVAFDARSGHAERL